MEELTYKQATLSDYDDFYKIKCDPENVKWSGFASAPDYERMKEWFCKQLDSEKRTIYIAYWNGVACGFFYLDKVTEEEFEAASSGVLKEFTGRGIGTWLVKKRIELAKEKGAKELSTWVADENPQSWKRFEKLGFLKTDIQENRMIARGGGDNAIPQVGSFAEEIGYGVLTAYSGRGIGSAIIRYATEVSNAFVLCAWVSDKNRASERCFEKNGFDKLAAKEQRMMSSGNALHDFFYWVKVIR